MRFRETLTQLQGSFYIVYTLQGPPPLGPNHFYTQSEGGGKARVCGGAGPGAVVSPEEARFLQLL